MIPNNQYNMFLTILGPFGLFLVISHKTWVFAPNHFGQEALCVFLAKNQVVLFLYSESIFKMDEMTERVAKVEGTITTELFIPKKIDMPEKWLEKRLERLTKSQTLHLSQVNKKWKKKHCTKEN